MTKKFLIFSLLLLIAAVAAQAQTSSAYSAYLTAKNYSGYATQYFINGSTGVDTGTTCASGSPCKTVAYVDGFAPACSVIWLQNGNYTGSGSSRYVHTTLSGTSGCHHAYVAVNYGGAMVSAPGNTSNGDTTWWAGGNFTDYVGLDITATSCEAFYASGTNQIYGYNRVHDVANQSNSPACGSGTGGGGILVAIGAGSGTIMEYNTVWNIGTSGNHLVHGLYGANGQIMRGNIVYNASGGCIQLFHSAGSDTVVNNDLNNCFWGIIIGTDTGAVSGITVANNNFNNNTTSGIYECVSSCGGFTMSNTYTNNNTFGNTNNMQGGGVLSNNVTTNPNYVNYASPAAGGNFHLASGSPDIGTGNHVNAPTLDMDGVSYANPPSIGPYEFVSSVVNITTTSLPNGTVGTAYSQTLAATGGTAPYTWSVTAGALPTSLTLSGGGVISGTPTVAGTFNFTVQAADSAAHTTTRALSIIITATALSVTTTSPLPGGSVGTPYSQSLAATGGIPPYTWATATSATPAFVQSTHCYATASTTSRTCAFTSNTTAGNFLVVGVSGYAGVGGVAPTVTVSDSFQTYSVATATTNSTSNLWTVFAYVPNAHGGADTVTVTLSAANTFVDAHVYEFSGVTISSPLDVQNATTGATSTNPQTLTGGSITTTGSNDLVLGLATVNTGSGNVLANGSYVSGSGDGIGSSTMEYAVVASASTFNGGSFNDTNAAGNQYTVATIAFKAASASGILPAGLTLSSGGLLSGTPTAAGTTVFTVTATDSIGTTANASLSFTAIATPLTITTTSPLAPATVGTVYSNPLVAAGGTQPYTWALTTGSSLPAGLSLSTSGVISGTPTTNGTFSFNVTATDSATPTNTSQSTFQLTVNPATLLVSTASLPGGQVSSAYTQTLAATGGVSPYTWSVSSGALPNGLTLSSGGVISGTPSVSGTFNFVAQVTDSFSPTPNTATKALSIAIAAAPGLPTITAMMPNGILNSPYSNGLIGSGGTTPYTWTITSGTLPTGLSIGASTGVISGTPSVIGTFTFTVQLTDNAGLIATASLQITVVANTTQASQTGPNTSASASFIGFPDTRAGVNTVNYEPGGSNNVSKLPIANLLYSGFNGQVYANFLPWFLTSGCTNGNAGIGGWSLTRPASGGHVCNGYSETVASQVQAQVNDAMSRGINGFIVDWHGPYNTGTTTASTEETATQALAAYVSSLCAAHGGVCPFHFAMQTDNSELTGYNTRTGLTPCANGSSINTSGDENCTFARIRDTFCYWNQQYFGNPGYLKVNGHPLFQSFIQESGRTTGSAPSWVDLWINMNTGVGQHLDTACPAVNPIYNGAANPGNVALTFGTGNNGFTYLGMTNNVTSGPVYGAYLWQNGVGQGVAQQTTGVTNALNSANSYYTTAQTFNNNETFGAVWPGFDDQLAGWSPNYGSCAVGSYCVTSGRITDQSCGTTWINSFGKVNSLYSSSKQIPYLQIVTWNDYDEGSEIETGIDNCYRVFGGINSNGSIQWGLTPTRSAASLTTVDHITVYAASSPNTWQVIKDNITPAVAGTIGGNTYSLPTGSYVIYAKMWGKNSIINQTAAIGTLTISPPPSGGGGGGGTGGGGVPTSPSTNPPFVTGPYNIPQGPIGAGPSLAPPPIAPSQQGTGISR